MSKNDLLKAIQKYQFYAIDLNLYLDNFPNNEKAKKDYEIVSHRLNGLRHKYEKEYGPLTNSGTSFNPCPSKWVDQPWPWEN